MLLRERVAEVMAEHWTTFGYSVPHRDRYPFQWLWDSCFHALIWAELGDDRAVTELASVFRHQTPSGFVPHVTYDGAPTFHADFWGRAGTSSITQPPMFGHATAELVRRGFPVPESTVDRATLGIEHLLQRPRLEGLVPIYHPWESGADDSPRWDDWFAPRWNADVAWTRKGELVEAIEYDAAGTPVRNPAFEVASAGFNALVAFNALELVTVTGDGDLKASADELAEALDARWDPELETWVDAGSHRGASGRIRTLDALLPCLVITRPLPASVFAADGHGTAYGPAGVHRTEPSYDPAGYWRGSTWPQIVYLLEVAATRTGDTDRAARLHDSLVAGVMTSGLAEHWNAETGARLGAVPQSWAGLAIVDTVRSGRSPRAR